MCGKSAFGALSTRYQAFFNWLWLPCPDVKAAAPGEAASAEATAAEAGKGKGKGKGPPPPAQGQALPAAKGKAKAKAKAASKPPLSAGLQCIDAEAARVKEQAIREGEERRAAHWRRMSSRSVQQVPWEAVKTSEKKSGGSGGAVLVQVGESEAVVLKPQGMHAVGEALAVEVASLVGVRVAQSRLVAAVEDEFSKVANALRVAPPMVQEQADALKRLTEGKEFIAVVEFVQGPVLQGQGGHAALTSPDSGLVLRRIGSLVALDCLLNNLDRLPAIWFNEGNLSNVMVCNGGEVIGIDQQVNPIGHPTGKKEYLQRVRGFCDDAKYGRADSACVARIKAAISRDCCVDLGEDQSLALLAGAKETFLCVASRQAELLDELVKVASQLRKVFSHAKVEVGLSQLDHMLDLITQSVDIVVQSMSDLLTC